jgi:glycosyltransferase involved in cell wall biosynthesis
VTARLPLTALVASRNEAHLLARCLASIAFCDELIVIDLESDDDTAAVAAAHGASVVQHPLVPFGEAARVTVAPQARHDWLLVTDPDEELPAALAEELARLVPDLEPDVAAVDAPIQYYFAGRPLEGTIWGTPNWRRLLVRRSGVDLTPTIWGGMVIKPGFRIVELPFTSETAIAHRWASGYRALVTPHRRYLRQQGPQRADAGHTTGYRAIVRAPWGAFKQSFVRKRGYRDGVRGFALSIFWAGFSTAAEIGLKRELDRRRRA